jgi:hypothetical protein
MVSLLIRKYLREIDWNYLEKRAADPENDVLSELNDIKERVGA